MEREVIFFDNGLSYPNILVLWRKGLTKPVVLACSKQHISVMFENVMVSCLHAECSDIRRRELWRDLTVIGSSNLSWIVVGEFNIFLRAGEKKGSRGVRWRAVEEFQDFLNNSCLLEANSSGSEHTWYNGKMGNNRILCKLDRMLCNQAWSNLFPGWKYKVMARVNSDHSPLPGWNVGGEREFGSAFRRRSSFSYCMGIYKWPASVINEEERILRNFFWYGEPDSRKACVVAWDKDEWSKFMRAKFISKSSNFSRITKGSSIWVGVRGAIKDVHAHSGVDIQTIKINKNKANRRVWKPDLMGKFSVKGASEAIQNQDFVTERFIRMIKFKQKVLLWPLDAAYARSALNPYSTCSRNFLSVAGNSMSPYLKDLWTGAVWHGSNLIWQARNKCLFEDLKFTLANEKRKWLIQIHDSVVLSTGLIFNNQSDLGILHRLGVAVHPNKHPLAKSCFWELPRIGEIKINTDGAAKGNLGKGGIGCIFRDCNGNVLGTLSKGLGLVTNFMAKCEAIIHGVEFAALFGWLIEWIESNSTTAVQAFKSNNIPWILEAA
ncbi:hypothetical protein GIB67_031766 [Kingdonia uniflora]|uniref:RNase H type-1 domain-containing protein n=1 Tax=Kingdonia uniflora TaxID=39325 RepID=A0A7J7NWK7_9MAGN|nr:hypothetical protein GIB67_031766 [Kingdonia uniflora]